MGGGKFLDFFIKWSFFFTRTSEHGSMRMSYDLRPGQPATMLTSPVQSQGQEWRLIVHTPLQLELNTLCVN
jgi:hypothetical protein